MAFSFRKALLAGLVLACAGIYTGETKTFASSNKLDVKIQVNDDLASFSMDSQPFVDEKGNVLVPARFISDKLGCAVSWGADGDQVTVILEHSGTKIRLTTDEPGMVVNRKSTKLESPARYLDGHVYVPIRDITEALGISVQWDNENGIAIIDADGQYHAPAWYAPKPAGAAGDAQPVTSQLLNTAAAYAGTPYVWGGTTPKGFDCSGFVGYVYRQYGIDLPRTSYEMYADAGNDVSDPQPGDLVFFARGRTVFHVGIYIGDGNFISATKSGGVSVNPLSTGYWGSYYTGAKRVL